MFSAQTVGVAETYCEPAGPETVESWYSSWRNYQEAWEKPIASVRQVLANFVVKVTTEHASPGLTRQGQL
ncbi:hypothetical protein AC579_5735 [Pseudocercospora musae]|uniref:Uncharacterized protein n=1 Tax=Pseudocercospora musae TaxID=113226 RepID=A0A139IRP1_9PEZI|nr:hypothetical protein AC579_5735 [Pseudocercospora musae]